VSVLHTVDRVLHCTVHTGHPNYNLLGPSQQALDFSTYRIRCFGNRKKSHAWLSLVIGISTAVSCTPHPTSSKWRHLQK